MKIEYMVVISETPDPLHEIHVLIDLYQLGASCAIELDQDIVWSSPASHFSREATDQYYLLK
jgi:hypothetical protein